MGLDLHDAHLTENSINTFPDESIKEFVSDVKVIYSDIDGTLLGPGGCLFKDSKFGFTDIPALAIIQCHINNIDIVPASGRSSKQLHSISRILGFNRWIAELGCQIVYDGGKTVVLNAGDFPLADSSIWESILQSGAPELLLREFSGKLEYHEPWDKERECTHLLRGNIDIELANNLLSRHNLDYLRMIDNGRVRRKSANLDVDLTEIRAYHLLPNTSNKASAVKKDIKMRDINKHQAIAIGDSEADLRLADEVGALFLVKNALNDSPQLIDRILDYNNIFITREEMGLGWSEVVRYLLKRHYR